MKNDKKIYLSLPAELCEKLQALADETFRTRNGYIRQIIKAHLREVENDPAKKII